MEEIFDKPKRKLSDKQLAALENGRLKREEKRLQKLQIDGVKEQNSNKKIQHKVKKDLLKEQEQVKKMLVNDSETKQNDSLEDARMKLKNYMIDTLDKIENPEQFKATKKYFNKLSSMNNIDEIKTTLLNDYKTLKS
jgi:hypothetical protein